MTAWWVERRRRFSAVAVHFVDKRVYKAALRRVVAELTADHLVGNGYGHGAHLLAELLLGLLALLVDFLNPVYMISVFGCFSIVVSHRAVDSQCTFKITKYFLIVSNFF